MSESEDNLINKFILITKITVVRNLSTPFLALISLQRLYTRLTKGFSMQNKTKHGVRK